MCITGSNLNSLIDERMEKEKDNIQDPEYYEKLKNVIEDEKKALVDNKQNEFEKKLKELEKKMSKTALRVPPKEKNPDKVIGYVKSLYFGYIYLKHKPMYN